MATFKKQPHNGKWRVWVRRTGYHSKTKQFATKREAEGWAAELEAKIASTRLPAGLRARHNFLDEMIDRYEAECLAELMQYAFSREDGWA